MKERPILFNGEMVRAILDGRKTQTRRVIKIQPEDCDHSGHEEHCGHSIPTEFYEHDGDWACKTCGNGMRMVGKNMMRGMVCKQGRPGDRLWVRETFSTDSKDFYPADSIVFRADKQHSIYSQMAKDCQYDSKINHGNDFECSCNFKWKPSIFMPRELSRINLEITNVRVERVQDISPKDASDEGANSWACDTGFSWKDSDKSYPVFAFQSLWDSINEKRGFGWDKNPWVWVVDFKQI